jgi:hypothetical protein
MFVNQVYLWPLATATCGTIVVSGLRYLALFIGLRLALRNASKADRLPFYREFARAMSTKGHSPKQDRVSSRPQRDPPWSGSSPQR